MTLASASPEPGRLSPGIPIVVAASASWETPAPVNVHQVAKRLAARGHRVLFLESTGLRAPSGASGHDWRRIAGRLRGFGGGPREVAPRLLVASPLTLPPFGPRALRSLSGALGAAVSARIARRLGFEDPIVWAFLPTALPLARRLGGRALVYHCVDDYAANPGVSRAWLEPLERETLRAADVVFATSPVLAARLEGLAPGVRVHEMPNVADVELFRTALDAPPEPDALRAVPRPRAIYVGNLAAYRVDFRQLTAVVDAGLDLVLVGAVGLGDVAGLPEAARRLLAHPRVTALGPQPHETLPSYLAHCDVALVPFAVNDHTRGSLPLKLWEYVAAGLPVVGTDLPNLRAAALGDAAGVLTLADSPEGFAEAALRAAAEPSERRAERASRAAGHGWPMRMNALCSAVAAALDSAPPARTVAPSRGGEGRGSPAGT